MAEQHVDDGAEIRLTVPNGKCRDEVRIVNKNTTALIAEVGLKTKAIDLTTYSGGGHRIETSYFLYLPEEISDTSSIFRTYTDVLRTTSGLSDIHRRSQNNER